MGNKISKIIADLLPKKIVYFVILRVWKNATLGENSEELVKRVSMGEVFNSWQEKQ